MNKDTTDTTIDDADSGTEKETERTTKLSFLLRPPVDKEEADAAAPHIHQIINQAYNVFESKGVECLLEYISKENYKSRIHGHCGNQNKNGGRGGGSSADETYNDNDDNEDEDDDYGKITGDARSYQIAMVERAKKQNTIVQLSTGLGKTLIAIMTIRNFAKDYEEVVNVNTNVNTNVNSRGHFKQTWFLVPSVALAVQQSNTLRVNLPYKIATACHTAAKSDKARLELSNSNIVVLTHGSALELLQHYNDVFYFERLNLIVVDECHHATKKHNYTSIFRQFYHMNTNTTTNTTGTSTSSIKSSRPRVLGLTATPIINVKNKMTEEELETKLRELEYTLDSKVVGLANLGLSMEDSGIICNTTNETSIYYENSPIIDTTYDNCIFPNHTKIGLHKSRIKEFNRLIGLLEEYGPVVVWRYCEVLIREISHNYYDRESVEEFAIAKNHLRILCQRFKDITQSTSTGGKTAKLVELEKLLHELYGVSNDSKSSFDDTIGIVFVQRKISAIALKHYFCLEFNNNMTTNTSVNNKSIIRSGMLTRKTTHMFKYLSSVQKLNDDLQEEAHKDWLHTVQDTKAVLSSLRSREINLLFATSVVEEGVDIDACSFVIILDELQTIKTYVQTKGRARQLDANFYVFENTHVDSQRPPLTLSDANSIDLKVSSYLGSRKEFLINDDMDSLTTTFFQEKLLTNYTPELSTLSRLEEEAVINRMYRTSNGMVDLASSKSLVNRYCSCIPMDLHARSSRITMKPYLPVYQNTFLLLPSHLPTHARNIYLPERFWTNSKKKNESLLALIACVRLYELNVLNERLLPLKRADIQQRLQKSTLRSLKRVSVVFNQMKPETKFKQKELYIYSLNQQGAIFDQNKDILNAHRKLCIISFTPLTCASSFSLQLRHRQLGLIHCSLGCFKQESITSSQWETCNQFYAALMNFRWRKRSGLSRYKFSSANKSIFPPYLVSCLSIADCLDWDYMQFVINEYNRSDYERKKAVQNWTGQAPRLFAPIYDPNNTYIAFKITDDKNCASPFPDKESAFESFGDYFFNRWSCKFSDDCKLVDVQRCWNLPSRAVEVKSIEEENNKEDYDIEVNNNCKGLVSVLLPKDACIETPIADPGLFLDSIMLPQILYELERMETMHEFVCHCSRWPILYKYLNTINLENITIAMTAKSCALGEVSYDRLEYLGDAVLKLIHTDALINSQDEELRRWFHCLHEGDLTELRNAMGCNKRLKDIAGSAGFDNFILTTPLGRGTWHPSSLEIYTIYNEDGGNPVKKVSPIPHFLPSEKVTADVIESILGLIYVQCGYEAATQVALELDISIPRSTESLHQMNPTEVLNTDDNLVKVATAFLGVDKIRDSSFVMEACTHPSKMNSSNYQRLEWIGDAVLCLASREWVYNHFQSFDVKDLVTVETILICNETLAMIAFSSGLQKYILHCDSTLPGRLEAYAFQIKQKQHGLWATDPPKVLADVVEALLGVAHIDGGLEQGQRAARHVVGAMLDSVKDHFVQGGTLMSIIHPVQAIMEASQAIKIRSYNMNDYKSKFNSPVWFGQSWDYCSDDICYGNIGQLSYYGLSLCEVADKNSRSVSKMRSSSLLFSVLNESEDLKSKLGRMTKALSNHDK